MNYGHRVRIGVLAEPAAAPGLASRSEELGYDLLVVAGDWTTLSWIAGRTSTIGLAAELEVHDPAVLARSAAALDLLSGGRVELILRGDPGPLAEAVDVIRGMLDAGQPGPLKHLGEHFRIPAAQRGPLPEHRIPIALAGGDPALAGRIADGWLGDAYKLVDEAALEAGREAAEIRRILTVDPDADLVTLRDHLDEGVDTLLLRAADPGDLDRSPVAELREAGPGTLPSVFRPASVRAKRRPGIAYDSLPESLAANAVEPGDADYPRVRSTYMRGGAPGLVLRPRNVGEVVAALDVVREHPHLPFGLRSRGHGISGRSTNDGGLVVSLAALDEIEILDESRRLVRIGAGARWTDVAQRLSPYGWALSSGDYGGVGVGGLATAGGVGWLARKHGLTIDRMRAAEVVLADGRVVRASDTENPDLFWAIRGAGGNFGVVTAFEFEVDEVGDVGFAQLVVGADDPAETLVRWGRAIEAAPRDLSGQLLMGRPRPGQPQVAQLMAVVDSADPATIIEQLQPVAATGPLYDQSVVLTPYAGIMANASDAYHDARGDVVSRSGLIRHLTPAFAAAAARLLEGGAAHWFQIRTVGGAVSDMPEDATAYAHRSANFSIVVMGGNERRLDAAWAELSEHFDGLYLSFETGLDRVAHAFPPATLARLRELKHRYDPDNMFRDNFNIIGGTR